MRRRRRLLGQIALAPVFQPRVVVHVFSPNDIEDLYAFLSDAAMQAFVAEPLDHITYPPRTDPGRLLAERERKIQQRPLGRQLEEDLYVMKMFRWLSGPSFLPYDGHLSPHGARAMADLIAAHTHVL